MTLKTTKVSYESTTFHNTALKDCMKKALEADYRVYIFQDKKISQIFIESSLGICSISSGLGGISIGSVHKPCRQCGTGYGLGADLCHVNINQINNACSCLSPSWDWSNGQHVKKWKSFEEKANSCSVLKYTEVIL